VIVAWKQASSIDEGIAAWTTIIGIIVGTFLVLAI